MAEITAKLVKELREKSGAGVMDAKKALVEVEGDIEKAIELLREKGMAKAAKKADRVAAEGLTGVYVNGNVAAVVEVNAETDFVAKNAQFVELVNETAKVIAEGKPANNEEALALTMPSGETLEAAYVTATATIGEKISLRRFAVVEKTDAHQLFFHTLNWTNNLSKMNWHNLTTLSIKITKAVLWLINQLFHTLNMVLKLN